MFLNNKKICTFGASLFMVLCLITGCGKDESLEEYRSTMEQYYSDIAVINYQMNSLDENTDSASDDLLALLDTLETLTSQMAEVEVPKKFEICESLADEAADNMSNAVSLYHQLYASDEYNESVAEGAYEYYERANKRIVYIKSILHGEMPEELKKNDSEDVSGDVSGD